MDAKHSKVSRFNFYADSSESNKSAPSRNQFKKASQNNIINNDCDNNEELYANFISTKCKLKKSLVDQCWYHGLIKRIETQRFLRNEGDFLVRESISGGPGHYVLSGLFKGNHVHFEINEYSSDEGEYSVLLYHFEDEKFCSIVDLIEFYVVHKKKITATCEFVLRNPILKKPDLFNIFGHNSQPDIEVDYASYVENFQKDSEHSMKTHQKATFSNKVLVSQTLEKKKYYNTNFDYTLFNQSSEPLNSKLNDANFKTKILQNENALFHRVERKVSILKYRPPSPPKSPPPPTPIQTQKIANVPTKGKVEKNKVNESELNDYCDIDYEELNDEMKKHKQKKVLSEQLNSKSLTNLTWKSNRCSKILDASNTSLNKVASSNNFGLINKNYKSSGNLLSTDGLSDTSESNFYTLHYKRSLAVENEYKTSKSASSWQNLLTCKNTLLNEERFYNEAAPQNYLTIKAAHMRDTYSTFHQVTPAPRLPLRRRSSTTFSSNKCLQNFDAILNTNNNNNNQGYENDYDKPLSSRHSKNKNSEFSDYNKISTFPAKVVKTTKRLNTSNFETLNNTKTEKSKYNVETTIELKNETLIDKTLTESKSSKINSLAYINSNQTPFTNLQTIKKGVNEKIDEFCVALSTTDLRQLAMWITEEDCQIFCSENAETNKLEGNSFASSLMDKNSKLRRKLINRVDLLSCATAKSIQNFTSNIENVSCQLIKKWSKIAEILLNDLDNAFSFGTIIGVLKNFMISYPEIWSELDEKSAEKLKNHQIIVYDQFINCNQSLPLYSVPFIQPHLQMLSRSFSEKTENSIYPLSNLYGKEQEVKFEFLWSFLKLSQRILLSNFENDKKLSNQNDKIQRNKNLLNNSFLEQLK